MLPLDALHLSGLPVTSLVSTEKFTVTDTNVLAELVEAFITAKMTNRTTTIEIAALTTVRPVILGISLCYGGIQFKKQLTIRADSVNLSFA